MFHDKLEGFVGWSISTCNIVMAHMQLEIRIFAPAVFHIMGSRKAVEQGLHCFISNSQIDIGMSAEVKKTCTMLSSQK